MTDTRQDPATIARLLAAAGAATFDGLRHSTGVGPDRSGCGVAPNENAKGKLGQEERRVEYDKVTERAVQVGLRVGGLTTAPTCRRSAGGVFPPRWRRHTMARMRFETSRDAMRH